MKYYSDYPQDKNLLDSYDPLREEEQILDFWAKKRTFEKIRENRGKENDGKFSYLCGPVFPTGSPHIGHVLNAVVKDIFMRYGYKKKLQVVGQFGWDCHGLPVEYEVDKKLGIKAHEDIHKIGIATYNEECRKFVQRHQAEWNNVFDRLGIWVDFTNTYSTSSAKYMENVWRVFKQLYDKGLVYKKTKVLPYSIGCFTHLSSFEAEQNWKEITEVGAIISVNIVDSDMKLLIWTTAPWKLVANAAICVNPKSSYVRVKLIASDSAYIMSRNCLPLVFANSKDYVVLDEFEGKKLENLRYQPLFDCLSDKTNTFRVLLSECIRDDLGTGIVAISPYFAQEDYRICLENCITFDEALCLLDDSGRFKQSIDKVGRLSIKEANDVILDTFQRLGHFVQLRDIKRKKPHCWRSDVPLIYKVASTWFLEVKGLAEKESQTNWLSCSINKTTSSRFTHSSDWAVGRNRYWGTPVPIWMSPTGDEIRCIGSIDELVQLTGSANISDLHREFVDELLIPSSIPGNPPLRRVPEVFDCWFESSVIPYVQELNEVDLIAEGIDQTCGWFYTSLALSAALNHPPPSKNIFVHGLVLGTDGSKISKRKHNNNDCIHMADKYGADALRLYLVTTPLVTGENFILQEDGVRKMVENVCEPIYKILCDIVPHFGKKGWVRYGVIQESNFMSSIFDRWILSCLESLMQFYDTEMSSYRLSFVIPKIVKFIESVQDWYIPISNVNGSIRKNGTFILFNVVYKTCLILAPFAPFFCEHIYQILEPYVGSYFRRDCIHDNLLTEKSNALIQKRAELEVIRWQSVIELVREVRMNRIVPFKYRISELIVVHPSESYLKDNELMNETLIKMANVHEIRRSSDRSKFGATLKATLKSDFLAHQTISSTEFEMIASKISQLSDREVEEVIEIESLDIEQYKVHLDDIQISYQFDKLPDKNLAIFSKDDLLVVVRMNKNFDYYEEGTRLELVSSVQKLKRKAKVFPNELVTVCYSTKDSCIRNAFEKFGEDVYKRTKSIVKRMDNADTMEEEIMQETVDIKGVPVILYIFKRIDSSKVLPNFT